MSSPNTFYVLLDMRHVAYAKTIAAYEVEAKKAWPNNNLSVVPNVDNTQCIVKVDAGSARPTWTGTMAMAVDERGVVLRTYKKEEHKQVVELLQTLEWKPKDVGLPTMGETKPLEGK